MKQFLAIALCFLFLLSGCSQKKPEEQPLHLTEYQPVKPVGTVPVEFQNIVENDLFGRADAFSDRLLELEYLSEMEYVIRMYDYSGNLLLEHSALRDSDAHYIESITCTSDGGFLYVIGFSDHANPDGTWASEAGVCSTIVKCSASGEIQWKKVLEDYALSMFRICLETDDGFYFFGNQETTSTKVLGVYSRTDIHILKLSKDAELLHTKIIGGSDYDSLLSVDVAQGGFTLNCRAQSSDGDFSDDGYWKISIDYELNILSMETGVLDIADVIGYLDGKPVRSLPDVFDSFHDGSVKSILDYGDFYLVVSSNVTGVYENQPPTICMSWNYYETVYGAYDKEGNVIWKAAVDASPDYDAMTEDFYQHYSE